MKNKNKVLNLLFEFGCLIACSISGVGAATEAWYGHPDFFMPSNLFDEALLQHSIRLFLWLMIYPIARFIIAVIKAVFEVYVFKERDFEYSEEEGGPSGRCCMSVDPSPVIRETHR
jgi:hypothetical protein